MSTPQQQEDLGELKREIDSWASRLAGAQNFHRRREELTEQIHSLSGFGPRDPKDVASVQERFFELKEDIPVLENLQSAAQRTREAITAFCAAGGPAKALRLRIDQWAAEWVALLDHILRNVGDRKAAQPAISQVKQLERWALERTKAISLINEATILHGRMGKNGKAVVEPLLSSWMRQFSDELINAKWLEEAGWLLQSVQSAHEAGKYDPVPPVQPAAPPAAEDPRPATGPQPSKVSLYQIDQLLSQCRDLAEALEYNGSEIGEFEALQFQLGDPPDSARMEEAGEKIGGFRNTLLQRADEESESRLRKLHFRWHWFQALYDERKERTDVAAMVAEAESSRAGGGLKQFFQKVQDAEQKIYDNVNANRPRLTAVVQSNLDECKAVIAEIRQEARLTSIDAAVAGVEKQIPKDTGPQINAQEAFRRLEACQESLEHLKKLREQNTQSQNEVLARAAALQDTAASIAAACDGRESEQVASIARRIPRELPASVFLDETAAALIKIEQELGKLAAQVRERGAAELARLRRDNLAWIRLLAEFAPEADALIESNPPPAELKPLRAAIDLELRHKDRIAELTASAVKDLHSRGATAHHQLSEHLASPAFKSHPERGTAEDLLAGLNALPSLADAPAREAFMRAYDMIADAETFIDRIESVRRELPAKVAALAERFDLLRERNGIKYRPDLSRRANILLQGMRKAIDRQEWDPLNHQISETEVLIAALEKDAIVQISIETEEVVSRLKKMMNISRDAEWNRNVQSALNQLESEGDIEPPSYSIRQRLNRLLTRGRASHPETRQA